MSDFVIMNPVVPGQPTRAVSDMNQLISNDNYLLGQIQQIGAPTLALVNGGFELGSGVNTAPIGWDLVQLSGGSSQFGASDEGKQSFQFNAPGGAGTGGGTLTSTDFLPIGNYQSLFLYWQQGVSNVNVTGSVQIEYYDGTRPSPILLSTDTLWTGTSPMGLQRMTKMSSPPNYCRFIKLVVSGGLLNSPAGSIAFDQFYFYVPTLIGQVAFTSYFVGAYAQPGNCAFALARVTGAGGGGESSSTISGVYLPVGAYYGGTIGSATQFGPLTSQAGLGGGSVSGGVPGLGGISTGGLVNLRGDSGKYPTALPFPVVLAPFSTSGSPAPSITVPYVGGNGGGLGSGLGGGINGVGGPANNPGTGGGGAGGQSAVAGSPWTPSSQLVYCPAGSGGGEGGHTEGIVQFSPLTTTPLVVGLHGSGGSGSGANTGGTGSDGLVTLDLYGTY